jgi:tRNA (guanine37-N1)-methyltransferase
MKLKDSLKGILQEDELNFLVRAYDVVGDIAIIIIPPELEKKERIIGDTILKIHPNLKVVAKRHGNYGGEFRTIPLKIIAGENRKETEYKEYGVRFFLNPEKVYFSVRSSNERKRLASCVKPGEDVLIMFSGIGVFPLIIAKNSTGREIVGIEKNKVAHTYAMKSLQSNKKIKNVTLVEGDVIDILPNINREFDRIAMPLPKTGEMYLELALSYLKKGGWLHFYDFQKEDTFNNSIEKIRIVCKKMSRTLLQSKTVINGHCSPKTYRICIDAKIA